MKFNENIPKSMLAVALHMVGQGKNFWRLERGGGYGNIYRLVMRSHKPTEKQMATCKFL